MGQISRFLRCFSLFELLLSSPYSSSLVLVSNPTEADSSQFALWVAFFEIYNESVYDLLQPSQFSKFKKRAALRVCDDGAGNAYVKGVSMSLSCVKLVETCQQTGFCFGVFLCCARLKIESKNDVCF